MVWCVCNALREAEATEYEDAWIEELGLDRSRTQPTKTTYRAPSLQAWITRRVLVAFLACMRRLTL